MKRLTNEEAEGLRKLRSYSGIVKLGTACFFVVITANLVGQAYQRPEKMLPSSLDRSLTSLAKSYQEELTASGSKLIFPLLIFADKIQTFCGYIVPCLSYGIKYLSMIINYFS